VAGRQGVPGAKEGRDQHGAQKDEWRQIRRPEHVGQLARQDPAGDRRRGRTHVRRGLDRGNDRPRVRGVGDGDGDRRERDRPVIERRGQEIGRVAGEPVGDAGGPHAVAGHGRARGIDDDLAPADSFGERAVREDDRRGRCDRGGRDGGIGAFEPERRQAACPRRERQPRGAIGQFWTGIPDHEIESSAQVGAGGDATGLLLGRRECAVTVGVHGLAGLERRDLRLVDDDIEGHALRHHGDPGVVIDGEVAQRVRGGATGEQHGSRCREHRREDLAWMRPEAARSSHRAWVRTPSEDG